MQSGEVGGLNGLDGLKRCHRRPGLPRDDPRVSMWLASPPQRNPAVEIRGPTVDLGPLEPRPYLMSWADHSTEFCAWNLKLCVTHKPGPSLAMGNAQRYLFRTCVFSNRPLSDVWRQGPMISAVSGPLHRMLNAEGPRALWRVERVPPPFQTRCGVSCAPTMDTKKKLKNPR